MASQELSGKRYPLRDCPKCEGRGWIELYTPDKVFAGHKFRKCTCWRYVSFTHQPVKDGKLAATGEA
jgi:hypothetical protein